MPKVQVGKGTISAQQSKPLFVLTLYTTESTWAKCQRKNLVWDRLMRPMSHWNRMHMLMRHRSHEPISGNTFSISRSSLQHKIVTIEHKSSCNHQANATVFVLCPFLFFWYTCRYNTDIVYFIILPHSHIFFFFWWKRASLKTKQQQYNQSKLYYKTTHWGHPQTHL